MATGHDLRGWTDVWARKAHAASGELRAGIDVSRGGRGVAYEARGYKQAGKTDGRVYGQADGPSRAKNRILARISNVA